MFKKSLILMVVFLFFAFGCSTFKKTDSNAKPAKEFIGMTLIAEKNFEGIDKFSNICPKNPPFNHACEFVANEVYTSKYGNSLEKGSSFTIGKATIVKNTDGTGYSGTKLVLESAAPKQGLFFYCYGIDGASKKFWALNKKRVIDIFEGSFKCE